MFLLRGEIYLLLVDSVRRSS